MKKLWIFFTSLIVVNWLSFSFAFENGQQFITSLENGEDLDTLINGNWTAINENNNTTKESTDIVDPTDIIKAITESIWNLAHTISDIEFKGFLDWDAKEILSNWFSREMTNAYNFAHQFGITTQSSINNANMNWWLNRIAMAKMLAWYATEVLWFDYEIDWSCYFADISDSVAESYNDWACKAYYLWIMWKNMPNNNFRPFDSVTRAEFATALSRLLFNTPDWDDYYYTTHLEKLYNEWIISNTDPDLQEIRWYVMLMLMRAVSNN